jgi:acyl-CoA synthetase (AMP-forming)/AMP-acid ligase II
MTVQPECSPVDYGGPIDRPFEPSFPCAALEGSVIDRFDAIVRRFPDRLAIEDGARGLTYAELWALVNEIAAAVTGATSAGDGPVAVVLRNEARFPAAMLGVLGLV